MPDVTIHGLDPWVLDAYKQRASAAGHSLEDELRETLTDAAAGKRRKALADIRAFNDQMRSKYGVMPDSVAGLREDREAE